MTCCPICGIAHFAEGRQTKRNAEYSLTKAGHLYLAQWRAEKRAAALTTVSGGVGWGDTSSPTDARGSG